MSQTFTCCKMVLFKCLYRSLNLTEPVENHIILRDIKKLHNSFCNIFCLSINLSNPIADTFFRCLWYNRCMEIWSPSNWYQIHPRIFENHTNAQVNKISIVSSFYCKEISEGSGDPIWVSKVLYIFSV